MEEFYKVSLKSVFSRQTDKFYQVGSKCFVISNSHIKKVYILMNKRVKNHYKQLNE